MQTEFYFEIGCFYFGLYFTGEFPQFDYTVFFEGLEGAGQIRLPATG